MNIYLDIDKTLIDGPNPAPHLEEFLEYAVNNHNCYWLTTRDKGEITESSNGRTHAAIQMTFYVSKDKWKYLDKIKTVKWNTWKTEGIDWSEDFLWLDDYVFPEEIRVLKEKGVHNSWVPINLSKNPNVLMDVINGLKNKNKGNVKEHMKKILHFEDEEMLANMYSVKMKSEGFDYKLYLHPPGSKEKLVNLVLAESPDLIIMDIIMPVMDGFKATEILKSDSKTKDIPIIGLCNMGQKEDIQQAKDFGMLDYVVNSRIVPNKFVSRVKIFFDDPDNYKPKFG
jgi:CheY-like chemotaxis protein